MANKYLPLGTVVSLNSNDSKIMIIGYYSVEYQNVVKIYDYVGCKYPEGLLLKNSLISFNHSDIINVDALGYVSDSFKVLNNNLNGQQNSNQEKMDTNNVFVNVKFDENGVVVYEELSNVKKSPEITVNPIAVQNPFVKTETGNESLKATKPTINNNFKFDENGIVIQDDTVKDDLKKIESNFKFVFDENGIVIGEETTKANPEAKAVPETKYQFSSNGVVIGEEHANEKKSSGVEYKFSNDGVVLEETALEMPKLKDGEKDKKPVYQFDANGIVINE